MNNNIKAPKKYKYEIRQVDAIEEENKIWTYNTSYYICTVTSAAENINRLFTHALKKHGITFYKNRTRIIYDGSIWEIVDRKTFEPLFCLIPEY